MMIITHCSRLIAWGTSLLMGIAVVSCESNINSSFATSPEAVSSTPTSANPSLDAQRAQDIDLKALDEHIETFTVQETIQKDVSRIKSLPIRMLWLVDNSSSMLDDKQAVSNGITSFTHALSTFQNVDIKITFISKMHENDRNLQNHGITVDPTSINSVNALIIAERYLTGTGRGFFTGTTMNIIVVVTDDCTKDITAQSFLSWLEGNYGNRSTFRFFGFIDTQHDSKHCASEGWAYAPLATALQGELFDVLSASGDRAITPMDWSTAFDKITSHVEYYIKGAINEFMVKHTIESITKVRQNGNTLQASEYNFAGTLVTVLSTVKVGDTIEITYHSKQQSKESKE